MCAAQEYREPSSLHHHRTIIYNDNLLFSNKIPFQQSARTSGQHYCMRRIRGYITLDHFKYVRERAL